uniref:Phosducin domain-containing protein n=1 Tax=Globodera pallida TaxID=36090 RepID=A0A183BJK5_GLOPA
MAALDEKLLDGPSVGYCSSSEDEDGGGSAAPCSSAMDGGQNAAGAVSDGTPRTGPKGVLADYERFQREKSARAVLDEAKFLEAANRFSLTQKPTDAAGDGEPEDELEHIRNRRVTRLKNMARGRILEVPSRLEFLSLIENESCHGALLCEQSDQLNDALLELAGRLGSRPATARFYKVQARVLGTSENFVLNALPALQVYRSEQLIGNFIRLSDDLGEDYDGNELHTFLRGHGIPLELDVKS